AAALPRSRENSAVAILLPVGGGSGRTWQPRGPSREGRAGAGFSCNLSALPACAQGGPASPLRAGICRPWERRDPALTRPQPRRTSAPRIPFVLIHFAAYEYFLTASLCLLAMLGMGTALPAEAFRDVARRPRCIGLILF